MTALAFGTSILSNSNDPLYTTTVVNQVWFQSGTSIVNLSLKKPNIVKIPFTPSEIVSWLRDDGLPIAAIADIANVERKSVYAWIDGGPIRPQNRDRLDELYRLFSENKQTELVHLYRFWNRKTSEGKSLSILLTEEKLNTNAIKLVLSELWPMAVKVKAMSESNRRTNQKKGNPFLEDINEAIIPDES